MNKLAKLIDGMTLDEAKLLLKDVRTRNIERLLEKKIYGTSDIVKPEQNVSMKNEAMVVDAWRIVRMNFAFCIGALIVLMMNVFLKTDTGVSFGFAFGAILLSTFNVVCLKLGWYGLG